MKNKSIVFLYISPGSGHHKACEAVRKAVKILKPSVLTYSINAMVYFHPLLGRIINKAYLKFLKFMPSIWEYLYDNIEVEKATRELRNILKIINTSKINSLIENYNPSAFVSTQAFPAEMITSKKLNIPVFGILTDYTVHAYWINEKIDRFFVPLSEIKDALVQRGLSPEKIDVTGIPVSPDLIRNTIPKEKIFMRFNLNPKRFTILLSGGSQGLLPITEIIDILIKHHPRYNVIAITGKNYSLYKKIKKKYRFNWLKVFRYTSEYHNLLSISNVMISKAGGLSTTEAIAIGVPVIVYKPLPGQESRNLNLLLKYNSILRIDEKEKLDSFLENLSHKSSLLTKIKENAKKIVNPQSAFVIAKKICDLINI